MMRRGAGWPASGGEWSGGQWRCIEVWLGCFAYYYYLGMYGGFRSGSDDEPDERAAAQWLVTLPYILLESLSALGR